MESFWQLSCNKNIVNQVSDSLSGKTLTRSKDLSQINLFDFVEEENGTGFTSVPISKEKAIKNKPEKAKNDEDNTVKTSLSIRFDGKKLDIEGVAVENKDGSITFKGSKKLSDSESMTYDAVIKDGKIIEAKTSSKKINNKGETIAYRNESKDIYGRCQADYYEERSNTNVNDKAVKIVTGHEEWVEDENGDTQEVGWITKLHDKKTGALELETSGKGAISGAREQLLKEYKYANSVYQGSVQERGEGKGISRSVGVQFDTEGQASFVEGTDYIAIDTGKEGELPIQFSTSDFELATSVNLSSSTDTSSEFADMDEIKEQHIVRTVDEDIIKKGGEIKHVMSDGTTITEFYKEVDGEIVKGYTRTNTVSGLVLDDYKETYDGNSGLMKSRQQLCYDKETGKQTGEREVYDTTSGISKYNHSYYMQGVLGDTMRYTTGTFDNQGHFTPDGNEDTVKFEQAGKEYSVAQLQDLLIFQKDYSFKKES